MGYAMNWKSRTRKKRFYFTKTEPVCEDMKTITLEKILQVLENGDNEIHVDDELRRNSKKPLERMLEVAK